MSFKIAIIGAGSVGFTKKLCSDILKVAEFAEGGIEIALTDISQANLDMIADPDDPRDLFGMLLRAS